MKKRIAAFLLAVLLLPWPQARAEDAKKLRVDVRSVFGGRTCTVVMLSKDGRLYLTPEEASKIVGLDVAVRGGRAVFQGERISREVALDDIPSIREDGVSYYALEPLADAAAVHMMVDRKGVIQYNSVLYNMDGLLKTAAEVLSDESYDANYLSDMGILGDISNILANAYDIVNSMRTNALWGGAFREDIRDLLLNILSPQEDAVLVFQGLEKFNKVMDKTADIVLGAQEKYENYREAMDGIPAGGDIFLFGVEGTEYIRETLEASQAVNDGDLCELILRARLGYAGASDYREAADALKGKFKGMDFADIHMYGLSDFLRLATYTVSAATLSTAWAGAMERVTNDPDFSVTDGGLFETVQGTVMLDETDKILNDFWAWTEQDLFAILASSTEDFLTQVGNNMAEDVLENAALGTEGFYVKVLTMAANWIDKTDDKTDAVRKMYLYYGIQTLFRSFLEKKLDAPAIEDYAVVRDGALLYLKCAWLAIDCFSSSSLGSEGVPTGAVKEKIEKAMGVLVGENALLYAVSPNEPVDPDLLRTGFYQPPVSNAETAIPRDLAYRAYYELLTEHQWVEDMSGDEEDTSIQYAPDLFSQEEMDSACLFQVADIDGNGTDELILHTEFSMAEAYYQVYTYGADGLGLLAQGGFQGAFRMDVRQDMGALRLGSAHSGFEIYRVIRFPLGGEITSSDYEFPIGEAPDDPLLTGEGYVAVDGRPFSQADWLLEAAAQDPGSGEEDTAPESSDAGAESPYSQEKQDTSAPDYSFEFADPQNYLLAEEISRPGDTQLPCRRIEYTFSQERIGTYAICDMDAQGHIVSREYWNMPGETVLAEPGARTEYVYDGSGVCVRRVSYLPDGTEEYTADYSFDAEGRRCAEFLDYPDGRTGSVVYSFDNHGDLIAQETYESPGEDWDTRILYEYDRDAQGRTSAERQYFYYGGSDQDLSQWFEYRYDEDGRCTSLAQYDPDDSIMGETKYSYDAAGRLLSETHYGYDTQYVMLSETVNEYDSRGRLTKRSYQTNGYNSLTAVKFVYDEDGVMYQCAPKDGGTEYIRLSNGPEQVDALP